ncbi:hypothetical protein CEUSTIGMA_g788.t1 [Chlamydomonas eustigma]|uniref:Uncharacterized protein n=1 Tax=Chlamydomonas eustigma TaxID=1157962 RepID=A0A250WR51_9CHLO|nr:hypothetical protein CEUSTIGMA_g788.t1 [Chlamydomonas eustigma]|eukprot:GAX73334.1 hypothetical protein CEUSTIGMA_g788.t1 [Chlamydomonas eustigma]
MATSVDFNKASKRQITSLDQIRPNDFVVKTLESETEAANQTLEHFSFLMDRSRRYMRAAGGMTLVGVIGANSAILRFHVITLAFYVLRWQDKHIIDMAMADVTGLVEKNKAILEAAAKQAVEEEPLQEEESEADSKPTTTMQCPVVLQLRMGRGGRNKMEGLRARFSSELKEEAVISAEPQADSQVELPSTAEEEIKKQEVEEEEGVVKNPVSFYNQLGLESDSDEELQGPASVTPVAEQESIVERLVQEPTEHDRKMAELKALVMKGSSKTSTKEPVTSEGIEKKVKGAKQGKPQSQGIGTKGKKGGKLSQATTTKVPTLKVVNVDQALQLISGGRSAGVYNVESHRSPGDPKSSLTHPSLPPYRTRDNLLMLSEDGSRAQGQNPLNIDIHISVQEGLPLMSPFSIAAPVSAVGEPHPGPSMQEFESPASSLLQPLTSEQLLFLQTIHDDGSPSSEGSRWSAFSVAGSRLNSPHGDARNRSGESDIAESDDCDMYGSPLPEKLGSPFGRFSHFRPDSGSSSTSGYRQMSFEMSSHQGDRGKGPAALHTSECAVGVTLAPLDFEYVEGSEIERRVPVFSTLLGMAHHRKLLRELRPGKWEARASEALRSRERGVGSSCKGSKGLSGSVTSGDLCRNGVKAGRAESSGEQVSPTDGLKQGHCTPPNSSHDIAGSRVIEEVFAPGQADLAGVLQGLPESSKLVSCSSEVTFPEMQKAWPQEAASPTMTPVLPAADQTAVRGPSSSAVEMHHASSPRSPHHHGHFSQSREASRTSPPRLRDLISHPPVSSMEGYERVMKGHHSLPDPSSPPREMSVRRLQGQTHSMSSLQGVAGGEAQTDSAAGLTGAAARRRASPPTPQSPYLKLPRSWVSPSWQNWGPAAAAPQSTAPPDDLPSLPDIMVTHGGPLDHPSDPYRPDLTSFTDAFQTGCLPETATSQRTGTKTQQKMLKTGVVRDMECPPQHFAPKHQILPSVVTHLEGPRENHPKPLRNKISTLQNPNLRFSADLPSDLVLPAAFLAAPVLSVPNSAAMYGKSSALQAYHEAQQASRPQRNSQSTAPHGTFGAPSSAAAINKAFLSRAATSSAQPSPLSPTALKPIVFSPVMLPSSPDSLCKLATSSKQSARPSTMQSSRPDVSKLRTIARPSTMHSTRTASRERFTLYPVMSRVDLSSITAFINQGFNF